MIKNINKIRSIIHKLVTNHIITHVTIQHILMKHTDLNSHFYTDYRYTTQSIMDYGELQHSAKPLNYQRLHILLFETQRKV